MAPRKRNTTLRSATPAQRKTNQQVKGLMKRGASATTALAVTLKAKRKKKSI